MASPQTDGHSRASVSVQAELLMRRQPHFLLSTCFHRSRSAATHVYYPAMNNTCSLRQLPLDTVASYSFVFFTNRSTGHGSHSMMLAHVEQENVQQKPESKDNSSSFTGCCALQAETSQSV